MLTSKQRAQLRALAVSQPVIIQVGKAGVTDSVAAQTAEALEARELVKGRVLDNSLLSPREACDELARRCGAEGVQVIGGTFVLYRRNEKTPVITLAKAGK